MIKVGDKVWTSDGAWLIEVERVKLHKKRWIRIAGKLLEDKLEGSIPGPRIGEKVHTYETFVGV